MFEDLIPSASAQTPAPSGMFDDLIPAGGAAGGIAGGITAAPGGPDRFASPRSMAGTDPGGERIKVPESNGEPAAPFSGSPDAHKGQTPAPGLFDDLIPAAAISGGGSGGAPGALAPEYEPIPDPHLGLKDAKTGIPLVRESRPGPFIAEVAGEDDGGLFWKDPQTGEVQRPGPDHLIRPEGGRFKVYERDEIVRPWTVTDMALLRAIWSGFTAAHDAFAGNMAPHEVIPRAVDFATLGFGGTRSPVTTWRPRGQSAIGRPEPVGEPAPQPSANAEGRGLARADPEGSQSPFSHPPNEGGTGTTGPPPEQSSPTQNGAPSGAVSVSGGQQLLRLPTYRIAGRPKKRGSPPIGDDGYPVERHHHGQVQDDLVIEMTRTDHRLGDNYRINHPNVGQRATQIDRARNRRERYRHWAREWDEGRFDNLPELSKTQMEELQHASRARLEARRRRSNE
jgi:A nuclease of the HNH/ENDO VII superfamily with conserved LHH